MANGTGSEVMNVWEVPLTKGTYLFLNYWWFGQYMSSK